MGRARNGTGTKWARARNGTIRHELGLARNGTGMKWVIRAYIGIGTKWDWHEMGWARNGPWHEMGL